MVFGEAIKTCFSKYATFTGRAQRSEFWYFVLLFVIAEIAGIIIDEATDTGVAGKLITLVLFLPFLAVFARRLHDIGRTGWWVLLPFVPVLISTWIIIVETPGVFDISSGSGIGAIVVTLIVSILLLVWCSSRGTSGQNRFGPDPLADMVGATSA